MQPSYFTDVTMIRIASNDFIPDVVASVLSSSGKQRLVKSLLECWAKWLYNCVSTGGHVLKGKVSSALMNQHVYAVSDWLRTMS